MFDDHAGQAIRDDRIDALEFFLLLERLGGVTKHQVADRVVEVVRRFRGDSAIAFS